MANPKVFEFAKEVGMETLALMAKIREWNLPVKSHMAELTPELIEQIKNQLNPNQKEKGAKISVKKKVKKVESKKAAPAKKAAAESPAMDGGGAGTVVTKVVRRKAADLETAKKADESDSAGEGKGVEEDLGTTASTKKADKVAIEKVTIEKVAGAVVAEGSVDLEKATKKKVVKRVASRGEVAESQDLASGEVTAEDQIPEVKTAEAKTTPKSRSTTDSVKDAGTEGSAPGVQSMGPTPVAVEGGQEVSALRESKASDLVGAAPTKGEVPLSGGEGSLPSQKEEQRATKGAVLSASDELQRRVTPAPARKKEVVVGQSGFASSQKPANEVVRKNIVGRMDLSRVNPPASSPSRGSYQGGGFQGGGGAGRPASGGVAFRSTAGQQTGGAPRMGAARNNLRAGFVAQPMPMPEIEEVGRRSKFEEKHKKFSKPSQEPGTGAALTEEEEAEFNSAEFRKREMVFQPKKRKGFLARESLSTQITTPKASKRILKINKTMKLSDVAEGIGVKAAQLTKALMQNGVMSTMNSDLDFETLALILPEFGWEAQNVFRTADEVLEDTAFGELEADPIPRPPVVTVMGHVDHGKTSLLDAIRKADVAAGEKGGITQHIGAYQVKLESGQLVTFLDTPGHEAFTAMRARGANATDIAVIVVAADDGVMPQTAEAINHAKAAGVPIVVALNKMDKPGANPDRIKQQLTEHEIIPEEWGGTNIFCEVSALKNQGIKEMLEQLLLVAEMQELKANPKRSGTGIVIESRLEKGRGSTATILVQDGTVAVGDLLVAGTSSGRVRSLMNDQGDRVSSAGPGAPVEVLGLNEVPAAGDKFDIVKDEKTMERVIELRKAQKEKSESPSSKMSLEEIFAKVKQGDQKVLNVILKSDVMGSSEAIQGMFQKLATDEVKIKVIHSAVGGISEGDVLLATTSKAIVLGFNTRPDGNAASLAKQKGVEIRTYGIVYEMMDDLKRLMVGLLEPDIVEQVHGRAEVRNLFTVPKVGTIAGCSVLDGKVARAHMVRLVRNGVVVYQGKIGSLKRFKDDAKEVASGFECGIGIENYNDLKVGDIIEAFTKEEVRRELSEHTASV